MTDKTHRSAITGEFVTAERAAANPDTTVSESRENQAEPIVRTVGDLTARHRGKRVRVLRYEGVLTGIVATSTRPISLHIADHEASELWIIGPRMGVTLDTTCEVLP